MVKKPQTQLSFDFFDDEDVKSVNEELENIQPIFKNQTSFDFFIDEQAKSVDEKLENFQEIPKNKERVEDERETTKTTIGNNNQSSARVSTQRTSTERNEKDSERRDNRRNATIIDDYKRDGNTGTLDSVRTEHSEVGIHNSTTSTSIGGTGTSVNRSDDIGRNGTEERQEPRVTEERINGNGNLADGRDQSLPIFNQTNRKNKIDSPSNNSYTDLTQTKPTVKQNVSNKNTDYFNDENFVVGNQQEKFLKNFEALKTLENIETSKQVPTQSQKDILNGYSGWGGLPQVFDEKNKDWAEQRSSLKSILSLEQYEFARNSTMSSFYTDKDLVECIYHGVKVLGVDSSQNNIKILEPSIGTGKFLTHRPEEFKTNTEFVGIEKDLTTYKIAKSLHGQAKIYNGSFEDATFTKEFDVIAGNPPYINLAISDSNADYNNLTIHNYFQAKSLEFLKENGIQAFVTTTSFLDSNNTATRQLIEDKNNTFLGAFRLPNTAFKNAGTAVSTDIIFIQKGKNTINTHQDFVNLKEINVYDPYLQNHQINEYFINNRENILGTLKTVTNQYGKSVLTVVEDKEKYPDLAAALKQRIEDSLPKNIFKYHEIEEKQDLTKNILVNFDDFETLSKTGQCPKNLDKQRTKSYFTENEKLYFMQSNTFNYAYDEVTDLSQSEYSKVLQYCKIKDAYNNLIAVQKNDPFATLVNEQNQLNTEYDKFVEKYKYLNNQRNSKLLKPDVEINKILTLEKNYSKEITPVRAAKNGVQPRPEAAEKADIFSQRVISFQSIPSNITPKEAFLISLSEKGTYSPVYTLAVLISSDSKYNSWDEAKINDELSEQNLIYKDHLTNSFIVADEYLSGAVKEKLEQVEELLLEDRDNVHLLKNRKALIEVQPPYLGVDDVSISLGSIYVPEKYYQDFFSYYFKVDKEEFKASIDNGRNRIEYKQEFNEWSINLNNVGRFNTTVNGDELSTDRADTNKIVTSAFTNNSIKIYDTVQEYNKDGKLVDRQRLNHDRTVEANLKVESLKTTFNDWIFNDFDRAEEILKIYNDKCNSYTTRQWSGEHLNLDGLNNKYTLRKHQKSAIWRNIQTKSNLFDHEVGAGKTLAAICSVMEKNRLGLTSKNLIVVPNHLIGQWRKEFIEAYPEADILVAEKDDFKVDKREQFFGKIINGNYDAIIMGHSQFKRIPAPYDMYNTILLEQIKEKQAEIDYKTENETSRFSVKRAEAQLETLKASLTELVNIREKSKALDFSDLGIDHLVIDEAHLYKNLKIITKMDGVSGLGNLNGSQQAMDLYTKVMYMHEKNQNITFLTGTPISNSITELYTMQRYLQPDRLKEIGINTFDSWANVFGRVSGSWELDTSAQNYKFISRFNQFQNVPELIKIYKEVADTVTNEDIMKYTSNYVPKLENDKPYNVIVERSDEVAYFIGVQDKDNNFNEGSIIWRMDHLRDNPQENNMLKCTTDARKAGLDYRLVDPDAADYEGSKLNMVVENTYKEWLLTQTVKGTQLLFCDLGTPKEHSQLINDFNQDVKNYEVDKDDPETLEDLLEDNGDNNEIKFDVYADVLKKLVDKGVPQNQIAFIHDAKADIQKQQLFQDVNNGDVRILLGSTSKMGAGTNVQKKVTAIHHIDCPWRPSDVIQRNGRVIRQGNELFDADTENFRIKEYRYATKQTYDARMWQVQESKSHSIGQFRNGNTGRLIDDVSPESMNASQMKAEATGNPLILMQVQLAESLKQEETLLKAFNRKILMYDGKINKLTKKLPELEQRLAGVEKLQNYIISTPTGKYDFNNSLVIEDSLSKIGGSTTIPLSLNKKVKTKDENSKEIIKTIQEPNTAALKAIDKMFHQMGNSLNKHILSYKGIDVLLDKSPFGEKTLKLTIDKGENKIKFPNLEFGDSAINTRTLLVRIENTINKLPIEIERIQKQIASNKQELKFNKELKLETPKEYPHIGKLNRLRLANKNIINEINKYAKLNTEEKKAFNITKINLTNEIKLQEREVIASNAIDKGVARIDNINKENTAAIKKELTKQFDAFNAEKYDVSIFKEDVLILNKQLSAKEVLENIDWLKMENAKGADIYTRPMAQDGSNCGLILLDDLDNAKLEKMKNDGYPPCVVNETSQGNFQAWLRVSNEPLRPAAVTLIVKYLAEKYQTNPNNTDKINIGKLAGFDNVKCHSTNNAISDKAMNLAFKAINVIDEHKEKPHSKDEQLEDMGL